MDVVGPVVAGVVAMVAAWVAVGYQHLLYRQPEYREAPASGRKLRALGAFAAVAAGLTAALAFRPDHYDFGPALLTAAFCFVLVVLSSTDFERKILPNRLMYPAIVAALAFAWGWPERSVGDVLLGGGFGVGIGAVLLALGLAFGTAVGVKATPFGLGDVKLIVLLGLLCGWPAIMSALIFGVLAAGVPGLAMVFVGKGRSVFSYGPYLAFGGVIVMLFPSDFV